MSDNARLMQYDANKKSVGIAYLLWFLLGMFGAHRFYLGLNGTGAAILVITVVSILLMVAFIGVITIWISIIWIFIDLFLIPENARKYNSDLATRLA